AGEERVVGEDRILEIGGAPEANIAEPGHRSELRRAEGRPCGEGRSTEDSQVVELRECEVDEAVRAYLPHPAEQRRLSELRAVQVEASVDRRAREVDATLEDGAVGLDVALEHAAVADEEAADALRTGRSRGADEIDPSADRRVVVDEGMPNRQLVLDR